MAHFDNQYSPDHIKEQVSVLDLFSFIVAPSLCGSSPRIARSFPIGSSSNSTELLPEEPNPLKIFLIQPHCNLVYQ